jgi:hypothetical protein
VVRVGIASVLVGGAVAYPLHRLGRTSVPGATTGSEGGRSWSLASGGTTISIWLVGLPNAVLGARWHVALLPSTLMAGSMLWGGVRIPGSDLLSLKRHRDDASPRSSMDDA